MLSRVSNNWQHVSNYKRYQDGWSQHQGDVLTSVWNYCKAIVKGVSQTHLLPWQQLSGTEKLSKKLSFWKISQEPSLWPSFFFKFLKPHNILYSYAQFEEKNYLQEPKLFTKMLVKV